ncbi:MAG: dephospho-CoA kinase [Nitriliruptor sp.]|uniref:dephospho-CoA kinase n=1 Tax=Nitriliruptor sp. TaxID=2448056 RepID=UPI0034A06EC2
MYLVGLTGGIGSGKSTVAARLGGRGWPIVDADQVAREIVEPGEPALTELAERFGADVLQADGSLDRPALARLAFADAASRSALDRITHPRIAARIAEWVATLGADDTGPDPLIAVVDHPLLIETGQAGRFDEVIVVLADEEVRLARLTGARGLDEDDARARMRAQTDDARRRAVATHVVVNEGTVEELERAVDAVADRIEAAARSDRDAGD